MAQIISFKRDCKTENYGHTPYQRVFYVGYRYVGPMLCQEVQRIYLKKKKFIYLHLNSTSPITLTPDQITYVNDICTDIVAGKGIEVARVQIQDDPSNNFIPPIPPPPGF